VDFREILWAIWKLPILAIAPILGGREKVGQSENSIFILTWALLVVPLDQLWRRRRRRRSWLPVGGMLAMMLKVDVEMGRFYSSRCAAELYVAAVRRGEALVRSEKRAVSIDTLNSSHCLSSSRRQFSRVASAADGRIHLPHAPAAPRLLLPVASAPSQV
jgi:hypothetical protein